MYYNLRLYQHTRGYAGTNFHSTIFGTNKPIPFWVLTQSNPNSLNFQVVQHVTMDMSNAFTWAANNVPAIRALCVNGFRAITGADGVHKAYEMGLGALFNAAHPEHNAIGAMAMTKKDMDLQRQRAAGMFDAKHKNLSAKEKELNAKKAMDDAMKKLNAMDQRIHEKERELNDKEKEFNDKEKEFNDKQKEFNDKENEHVEMLASDKQWLHDKETELKFMEKEFNDKEMELNDKEMELAARCHRLDDKEMELAEKGQRLHEDMELADKEMELTAKGQRLHDREMQVADNEMELAAKGQRLNDKEMELAEKGQRLNDKEKELNDKEKELDDSLGRKEQMVLEGVEQILHNKLGGMERRLHDNIDAGLVGMEKRLDASLMQKIKDDFQTMYAKNGAGINGAGSNGVLNAAPPQNKNLKLFTKDISTKAVLIPVMTAHLAHDKPMDLQSLVDSILESKNNKRRVTVNDLRNKMRGKTTKNMIIQLLRCTWHWPEDAVCDLFETWGVSMPGA